MSFKSGKSSGSDNILDPTKLLLLTGRDDNAIPMWEHDKSKTLKNKVFG